MENIQAPISNETVADEVEQPVADEQQSATEITENEQEETTEEQEEKIYKVKINGVERDLTENQFKMYLQKDLAGDEKLKKAHQLTQQVGQLIDGIKSNPLQVLQQLGINIDEVLEKRMNERIEEYSMSPEKKEALKYKSELEQLRAEKEEIEKQKQEAVRMQQVEQYKQAFETKIIDTIESTKLPKTPEIAREMAYYMEKAIKKGIEPDMNKIATYIKQKIRSTVDYLNEDEDVETLLESPLYKRLKELEMKKVKNPIRVASEPKAEKKVSQGKKYSTWDEMEEEIRKGLR